MSLHMRMNDAKASVEEFLISRDQEITSTAGTLDNALHAVSSRLVNKDAFTEERQIAIDIFKNVNAPLDDHLKSYLDLLWSFGTDVSTVQENIRNARRMENVRCSIFDVSENSKNDMKVTSIQQNLLPYSSFQ